MTLARSSAGSTACDVAQPDSSRGGRAGCRSQPCRTSGSHPADAVVLGHACVTMNRSYSIVPNFSFLPSSGNINMRSALIPIVFLVCLLALIYACFGSMLFFNQQFAFRDSAHFYYPLYLRVQQEWDAGRWPLWESEENGGMPLLGNPTAAVLYPGKILYAGKLFSYAWGARLYVVAHTLLACAGMLVLLRSWSVSWEGSALGALSYAFGAPILFQYCNIIFLVGAAWLPWGFRSVDRWLRLGRRWALLELAVVLAMQTLGGDPQAAYLTGICAAGYAVGLTWRARAPLQRSSLLRSLGLVMIVLVWVATSISVAHLLLRAGLQQQGQIQNIWSASRHWVWALWAVIGLVLLFRWGRGRSGRVGLGIKLMGLAGAAFLAFNLAAAQLLPVLEFTRISVRSAEEGPHTIYPFSLEPCRAIELIWPNVYGTSFGVNRSWLPMVPPLHTPSTWVPSLYLGGLALVLALGAAGYRGGPPWRGWLTAVAILSFVVSLGQFGSPLWWARSIPGGARIVGPHDPPQGAPARKDGAPNDGDGSPYWLLANVLPGFGSFRYPSKLLNLTSLAIAALAGIGWDRVRSRQSNRVLLSSAVLLAISLSALAATAGARARIIAAFAAHRLARGGSLFGPFDPAGALADTQRALVHGAVVFSLALTVVLMVAQR